MQRRRFFVYIYSIYFFSFGISLYLSGDEQEVCGEQLSGAAAPLIDRSGLDMVAAQQKREYERVAQLRQQAAEQARAQEARLRRLFTWVPRITLMALACYVLVQSHEDLRTCVRKLLERCGLRERKFEPKPLSPSDPKSEFSWAFPSGGNDSSAASSS